MSIGCGATTDLVYGYELRCQIGGRIYWDVVFKIKYMYVDIFSFERI